MVFKGQDAWRKHPYVSGLARQPLPGLGVAIGIFSLYIISENIFHFITTPKIPAYSGNFTFKESGDFGDAPPTSHRIK